VAVAEPNRTLVLQSSCGLPPATLPIRGPAPYLGRTWTGSGASTCGRLPAAGPAGDPYPDPGGRPRLVTRPFGLLVGEPVHFIMQTRQFHNLRTRVGAEV